ncbi:MAG: ATP-binding protein [Phenylobacterium sp.]|uniref:ATP-binding protein n=1 Tax=Phenylobacterium sp. TaxID=1871053 RepID=UPI0025E226E8|nr:ATP-binding protein [Phenylobacterium sp.]MBI1200391.1 ATP-binding protein [Phenylobacterium sp.]
MDSDFSRTLNARSDFPAALDALESHLADRGAPQAAVSAVMVAADEVISNILNHGGDAESPPRVEIDVRVGPGEVAMEIVDDGLAFNPIDAPAPDTALSVEDRAIGGLGIHLVRELMDSVRYERADGRNRLWFVKTYGQASKPSRTGP